MNQKSTRQVSRAPSFRNTPVPPPRRICILAIHGIGQQPRGDSATQLAHNLYQHCCKSPQFDSVSPLHLNATSRRGPAATFTISSPADGTTRVDIHELFWGPIASTPVRPPELLHWLLTVVYRFTLLALTRPLPGKMYRDALQLIALVLGIITAGNILLRYTTNHSTATTMAFSLATLLLLHAFACNYLGDLVRYFSTSEYHPNSRIRRQIQSSAITKLLALLRTTQYDQVIPVAHSLGSVILLDVLPQAHRRTTVAQWHRLSTIVTIGSPMAKCQLLKLTHSTSSHARALSGKKWANFYFALDPVADVIPPGAFGDAQICNFRVKSKFGILCHTTYWRHPSLSRHLLTMVAPAEAMRRHPQS